MEFVANGVEYDYTINAADGAVIARDADGQMPGAVQSNAPAVTPPAATSSVTTISAERAKEIALQHASLSAADVNFVHSELDYDDGVQVYDVEFYTQDGKEYDYEIDGATGEVIGFDYEAEGYGPPAAAGGSGLTAEEAKALALANVPGATDADIREFEMDRDDGRTEYEGEIVYGGMAYEFEIDGSSGMIRSWEVEPAGR